MLRRLRARLRRRKTDKGKDAETGNGKSAITKKPSSTDSTISSAKTMMDKTGLITPAGQIIATKDDVSVDIAATREIARHAKIRPRSTTEIVPGVVLKRDDKGRIHIKIVFYGPSLSGKTTALRWLFANIRSLSKSKIVEVSHELGRTTWFDFIPIMASDKVVFDVFTVAGQRRHAKSRITVLRDADGIIFMADSGPESMSENLHSIQELRIALGTDRLTMMPLIVSLNKRDIPNALPVDYMIETLDLDGMPIFPTIATSGKNLLRMFQRVLRDALIFRIGI